MINCTFRYILTIIKSLIIDIPNDVMLLWDLLDGMHIEALSTCHKVKLQLLDVEPSYIGPNVLIVDDFITCQTFALRSSYLRSVEQIDKILHIDNLKFHYSAQSFRLAFQTTGHFKIHNLKKHIINI